MVPKGGSLHCTMQVLHTSGPILRESKSHREEGHFQSHDSPQQLVGDNVLQHEGGVDPQHSTAS